MSSTVMNNIAAILKEFYDGQGLENLVYSDRPFLAMVPKKENFPGKFYPIPVQYSLGGGQSQTFSKAYANQSAYGNQQFEVTKVESFSLASMNGQAIASTQSDKGAFVSLVRSTIDSAVQAAANRLALQLYRNGAGTVGQIAALDAVSGSGPYIVDITLARASQTVAFNDSQVIQSVQNADGTGTTPSSVATITARNSDTGVIRVTSDANISSTWTVGYYLATEGDLPNATNNNFAVSGSASNSLLAVSGTTAWIPLAGPGVSDAFFNVNRNLDTTRLAGTVYDGRSQDLETAILAAAGKCYQNGGTPTHAFMSVSTYLSLLNSLSSKLVRFDQKMGKIAFDGIEVYYPGGKLKCFADRNVQDGVIHILRLDSWELCSIGPAISPLTDFGNPEIQRYLDSDSYQVRIGGYQQLICKRPVDNAMCLVQYQAI